MIVYRKGGFSQNNELSEALSALFITGGGVMCMIDWAGVYRHAGPHLLQRRPPHPGAAGPLARRHRGGLDGGLPPPRLSDATWLRAGRRRRGGIGWEGRAAGTGTVGEPAVLHTGHVAGRLPEKKQGPGGPDFPRHLPREESRIKIIKYLLINSLMLAEF
jgi:hypothetical protein